MKLIRTLLFLALAANVAVGQVVLVEANTAQVAAGLVGAPYYVSPRRLTSAGLGTVSSVSVTTANGVSAAVANPSTTPALTFTLGAITPSSVSTGALTSSALTSGRVPFATTAGLLTDSSALTFNSGTGALSATNFVGTFRGNTFTTGTGTLTIAAGKTLTSSNTLTLAGTDGTTITFPATSATVARTDAVNSFTGQQSLLGSGTSTGLKLGATAGVLAYVSADTTSGKFTIQTASADGSVDINHPGGARPQLSFYANSVFKGWLEVNSGTMALNSANNLVFNTNSGNAAVTISIAQALRFNAYGAGALTTDSSGNITATSDARLKEAFRPFTRGLAEIREIHPFTYRWKRSSGLDTTNDYSGFVAQDVQRVIPEAIGRGADGMLTFNDRPVLAAVVNSVVELDRRTSADWWARSLAVVALFLAVRANLKKK